MKSFKVIKLTLQAINTRLIPLNQFKKNNLLVKIKDKKFHMYKNKFKFKNNKFYKNKKFIMIKISSNYFQ